MSEILLLIASYSLDHTYTQTRAGTFSWQDPVNSWKAGPGLNGIRTVENWFIYLSIYIAKVYNLSNRDSLSSCSNDHDKLKKTYKYKL